MGDDTIDLVGSEKVLTGMSFIVNAENTNDAIDIRKIENDLLNDKSFMTSTSVDELYTTEMNKISDDIKLLLEEHAKRPGSNDIDDEYKDIYQTITKSSSDSHEDGLINFSQSSSYRQPLSSSPIRRDRESPLDGGRSSSYNDGRSSSYNDGRSSSYNDGRSSSYNDGRSSSHNDDRYRAPSRFMGTDNEYSDRTTEEIKNKKITNVMNKLGGGGNDSNFDIYDDDENDRKMMLIESIESYLEALSDEGVNIEKYNSKMPDENSDIVYIERFHRFIERKYNRITNSTFAEDAILMGALGLEEIFDGQTVYFNGRFKPNLKGWNQVVKAKLRRNKHNTSAIVSNIIDTYQPHPLLMLLINLVPSMIFYSHTNQVDSDTRAGSKVSNNEISNAIHNLRSMD